MKEKKLGYSKEIIQANDAVLINALFGDKMFCFPTNLQTNLFHITFNGLELIKTHFPNSKSLENTPFTLVLRMVKIILTIT